MIQQSQLTTSEMARDAFFAAELLGGSLGTLTYDRARPESGTGTFRGRLEVAGLMAAWPEQDFIVLRPAPGERMVKIAGPHPWPDLTIHLDVEDDDETPVAVRSVHLEPADNTADAEIYFTRVEYALMKDGSCRVQNLSGGRGVNLKVRAGGDQWFIIRSAQARKLKFLEKAFGVNFSLPQNATWGDARRINAVFRGITEGDFSTRLGVFTLEDYAPKQGEMERPPFTAPGSFEHTLTGGIKVFNQRLDVGPVAVRLDRAEVFDSDKLDSLRRGSLPSADVKFVVLDHQVHYRFVDYVGRSEDVRRRVEEFEQELSADEPSEMVELLTAWLEYAVSDEEARQIVIGWLQYYDFPDRFWPHLPELEGERWKVPVWIAYPDGRGALVENAFVGVNTGEVSLPISVEELLERGKAVADTLLRAG